MITPPRRPGLREASDLPPRRIGQDGWQAGPELEKFRYSSWLGTSAERAPIRLAETR
jgi:hypothetical protein